MEAEVKRMGGCDAPSDGWVSETRDANSKRTIQYPRDRATKFIVSA